MILFFCVILEDALLVITKEVVVAGAAVQAIRIVTLSHLLSHSLTLYAWCTMLVHWHMVQPHDYIVLSTRLCLFSCIILILIINQLFSKIIQIQFVQA